MVERNGKKLFFQSLVVFGKQKKTMESLEIITEMLLHSSSRSRAATLTGRGILGISKKRTQINGHCSSMSLLMMVVNHCLPWTSLPRFSDGISTVWISDVIKKTF